MLPRRSRIRSTCGRGLGSEGWGLEGRGTLAAPHPTHLCPVVLEDHEAGLRVSSDGGLEAGAVGGSLPTRPWGQLAQPAHPLHGHGVTDSTGAPQPAWMRPGTTMGAQGSGGNTRVLSPCCCQQLGCRESGCQRPPAQPHIQHQGARQKGKQEGTKSGGKEGNQEEGQAGETEQWELSWASMLEQWWLEDSGFQPCSHPVLDFKLGPAQHGCGEYPASCRDSRDSWDSCPPPCSAAPTAGAAQQRCQDIYRVPVPQHHHCHCRHQHRTEH